MSLSCALLLGWFNKALLRQGADLGACRAIWTGQAPFDHPSWSFIRRISWCQDLLDRVDSSDTASTTSSLTWQKAVTFKTRSCDLKDELADRGGYMIWFVPLRKERTRRSHRSVQACTGMLCTGTILHKKTQK